jgi:hypothetical protein
LREVTTTVASTAELADHRAELDRAAEGAQVARRPEAVENFKADADIPLSAGGHRWDDGH